VISRSSHMLRLLTIAALVASPCVAATLYTVAAESHSELTTPQVLAVMDGATGAYTATHALAADIGNAVPACFVAIPSGESQSQPLWKRRQFETCDAGHAKQAQHHVWGGGRGDRPGCRMMAPSLGIQIDVLCPHLLCADVCVCVPCTLSCGCVCMYVCMFVGRSSAQLAAVCTVTAKDDFCVVVLSLTDGSTVRSVCSSTTGVLVRSHHVGS
jgi:hypothetical protein